MLWKAKEKKKILVIDDEKPFSRIIKLNLDKTRRYEVREENDGTLGLSAAKEFKPDLILLDILMPKIDGSEVANQLKNDEETKDIPIVFLTAVATKDQVEKQSGVIGGRYFLAKPVGLDELIACIEKHARRE